MTDSHPSEKRAWWSINVTGYGRFEFYGSRIEADQMMRDKTAWEGGRGSMRRATPKGIDRETKNLKWKQESGYPMDENELEALR